MSPRAHVPGSVRVRLATRLLAVTSLGLPAALGLVAIAPVRAAAGEAILYRTADGTQGIVSDPAAVPDGATIVTERRRAVVRLPAAEIERSIRDGASGGASSDASAAREMPQQARPAGRSDDGAWDTSLPPAPPEPRPPPRATQDDAAPFGGDTTRSLDSVSESLDDASGSPVPGRNDGPDDASYGDAFEPDDGDLTPTRPGALERGGTSAAPGDGNAISVPSLSPEERRAAEIAHRDRCEKLGLFGYACTPEAMAEAERWGALARLAREKRELGEARVAHLRERYAQCTSARQSAICPQRELEAAERRLAILERREEQIEDACRASNCLPGWLRL